MTKKEPITAIRCPECGDLNVCYVEYIAAKRAILGFTATGELLVDGLIYAHDYESDIIDRRAFWCSQGHEWPVGDIEMGFE